MLLKIWQIHWSSIFYSGFLPFSLLHFLPPFFPSFPSFKGNKPYEIVWARKKNLWDRKEYGGNILYEIFCVRFLKNYKKLNLQRDERKKFQTNI